MEQRKFVYFLSKKQQQKYVIRVAFTVLGHGDFCNILKPLHPIINKFFMDELLCIVAKIIQVEKYYRYVTDMWFYDLLVSLTNM